MLESIKILFLCIAAAVLYGICHDLITTRICVEYFTIAHPPVWGGTENPTLLAFTWGVKATWWVGAILSLPVILIMRAGSYPILKPTELIRPLGILLITMAICSTLSGLFGYNFATSLGLRLWHPFDQLIAAERHDLFFADLFAHNMAYFIGFFGGMVVCAYLWFKRHSQSESKMEPQQQS